MAITLDGTVGVTTPQVTTSGAGVQFSDSSILQAIPPQPYNSWVLDEGTCLWNPPVPMPTDGNLYNWDEATTSWILSDLDATNGAQ
jgi:hypothetical protein